MRRRAAIERMAISAAVLAAGHAGFACGQAIGPGDDGLFDAAGFRRSRYRSPVNRAPTPAGQVLLARALTLRPGQDALFYDVLPAEGGVRDPTTGRWTLPASAAHDTIPGARWFPEVGRAPVDPRLWGDFAASVAQDRRQHDLPAVLFCRADCWMSWNAARRLALAGVANVWWLAEGIDGWHDAQRALVPVLPENPGQAR